MPHLDELLSRFEYDTERLLASQQLDTRSPRFGAYIDRGYHADARCSGYYIAQVLVAYICRESRLYLKANLKTSIEAGFTYLERSKRPSGCLDLTSCNFDSAPDTAFTANEFVMAWWLLEKRMCPELRWLEAPLRALLNSLAEGIAAGGFHTPNHRWAIASSLKCISKITGRADFDRRADEYLYEGLDINEDGEFSERSAGAYNQVNDDQMIRLYMATGDAIYLDAARKNLNMMYAFIDPDGSIFTNNSTRQDRGQKMYPGSYYILYLLTGYLAKDKSLAAMAEYCYTAATKGAPGGCEPPFDKRLLVAVPWLLLFDGLEELARGAALDEAALTRYSRCFPASGVARARNGNLSMTVMTGKPNFLYIQNGALTLYMVIHSHVCGFTNFTPQKIEPVESGYRASSHIDGWYYLPFYPEKPDTSDWWAMDNPAKRKRIYNVPLDTTVEATLHDGYVDVRVRACGYDGIPFRIELGVTPCDVRHESFIMEGKPGASVVLLNGALELTGREGDVLMIENGFAEHGCVSRRDNAFPESGDHFTVYMTAYSPLDKRFRVSTRGFDAKEITKEYRALARGDRKECD